MSQTTPRPKLAALVGASPIPPDSQHPVARAGVQREKTVCAGRKVAVVGEAARQGFLGSTRATSASFKA